MGQICKQHEAEGEPPVYVESRDRSKSCVIRPRYINTIEKTVDSEAHIDERRLSGPLDWGTSRPAAAIRTEDRTMADNGAVVDSNRVDYDDKPVRECTTAGKTAPTNDRKRHHQDGQCDEVEVTRVAAGAVCA